MRKTILIILPLILIIVTGCKQQIQNTSDAITGLGAAEQKLQADKDIAVINARTIFRQAQINGQDLSNGPCLSNNLMPDWVLDIAHDPRQSVDNLPENQCSAFREGEAHHFIEMDESGKIIKIY